MTRYGLTFKRYACPSCGAENYIQPIRSINTLVQGLAMPSSDALNGETFCTSCNQHFETNSETFLGWLDERTPPKQEDLERYSIPNFLKKTNSDPN